MGFFELHRRFTWRTSLLFSKNVLTTTVITAVYVLMLSSFQSTTNLPHLIFCSSHASVQPSDLRKHRRKVNNQLLDLYCGFEKQYENVSVFGHFDQKLEHLHCLLALSLLFLTRDTCSLLPITEQKQPFQEQGREGQHIVALHNCHGRSSFYAQQVYRYPDCPLDFTIAMLQTSEPGPFAESLSITVHFGTAPVSRAHGNQRPAVERDSTITGPHSSYLRSYLILNISDLFLVFVH